MRFPEFSGEWEKHTIGELCEEFKSGKNIKAENIQEGGVYPVFGGNGLRGYADRYNHEGDYVLIGRQGALCGNVRFVTGKTYITEHAIAAKATNNNYTRFLEYLFVRLNLGQFSDQSAQPGLAVNKLLKIETFVPSKEEQYKIASLLKFLDERIATQNKIIEKLESLIKGITDKLLCNFSWEKVYLRSFMEFYPTNSFSWEQLSYEKGTIRNLHYGLIHGISTKSITTKTLPFISSNKADSRFVCCHNGDVAFADASEDTADIGKAVEFTDVDNTNVVCGLHTIHGRDVKELTIVGFKGFMFNSSYFHEQVRRVAQGTKVFSISANNLSSCYVYIPDKSEQTKITGLLYSMEMKISLSSKLLERYKIQKEYLLRQMFI